MSDSGDSRRPQSRGRERLLVSIVPDFWRDVAARLLDEPMLSRWVVIVPSQALGGALRAELARALRDRQGPDATLLLPQVRTLAQWAQLDSANLPRARTETARRVELFEALQSTTWLTGKLGAADGQLWHLARQLLAIGDELTLGLGAPQHQADRGAIETRILAVLKGSYQAQSWQACSDEAELVLAIWRQMLTREDGSALLLRALERLANQAPSPLCVIAPFGVQGYGEGFVEAYADRQPVLQIEVDLPRSLAPFPAFSAAWPEVLSDEASGPNPESMPLLDRADRLARTGLPLGHVRLMPHNSLEEESVRAAQTILDWIQEGRRAIALVTLDRLTVRRVRALLERAQVLVSDEGGWKLSTSTVAGSLMRWLELVDADETRVSASVLLDWLKSPHALSELPQKAALIGQLELALRRENVVRGWSRMARALGRDRDRVARADAQGALPVAGSPRVLLEAAEALVARLRALAVPLRRRSTLVEHFAWLSAQLEATQMARAFSGDAAGRALLEVLADLTLEAQPGETATAFTFTEWRDYLADALENATFRERSIDSPIVALPIEQAVLRAFDAVIVVGANREHFPGTAADTLFLNPAVRAELGLGDAAGAQRDTLRQLALVCAGAAQVAITWRSSRHGVARAAAPALQRLSMIHAAAFNDPLVRDWQWPREMLSLRPVSRPAPTARGLVPSRLSASGYNRLVSCPYRYFVRYVLGLVPLEALSEDAEKRDYGQLVHQTLERFHAVRAVLGDPEEAQRILEAVSGQVFGQAVAENPAFLGYQVRWEGLIASYITWWTGWEKEGWRMLRSEIACDTELTLAGSIALTLDGRLDRIDHRANEQSILDYKARSVSDLKASLRDPGEDVQLPFYRLLLRGEPHVEARFLSVDRDVVQAVAPPDDLDALSAALLSQIVHTFEQLHEGAGLPAHGAETVCSRCDARGVCRKGLWRESALPASTGRARSRP